MKSKNQDIKKIKVTIHLPNRVSDILQQNKINRIYDIICKNNSKHGQKNN